MTKKTAKLQREWYYRLKKTGFNDIEASREPNRWTAEENFSPLRMQYNVAKQEYYRLAEHFVNSHQFKTKMWKRNKKIFKLHSEGMSYTEITKKVPVTWNVVRRVVENLVKVMLEKK